MDRLLENVGADIEGDARQWNGSTGSVFVSGTLSGATVHLEVRHNVGDWLRLHNFDGFTSPAMARVVLPDCEVRAITVGGDGSTSVSVDLV
ncbi:MAG: hypothetical protein AAF739_03125 [Pseudomonadota bacterium]